MSRAEDDHTDTGIHTYHQLAAACGAELALTTTPHSGEANPAPPTTYRTPAQVDPWDWDAICWILDHDRALESGWTPHVLLACLRRQPHRVKTNRDQVERAAALARVLGVQQVECHDAKTGKTITRLVRTDEQAPNYPTNRVIA